MNKRIPKFSGVCVLFIALIFSNCASVSVKEGKSSQAKIDALKKPEKIYIMDFDVDLKTFRVDREGEELNKFRVATAEMMSKALVERFSKYLIPTERLAPGEPMPKGNFWLVKGKFTKLNQGSRALRMFIGFGAGGTKMETAVEVCSCDCEPKKQQTFLAFETTGGSGAMPGAIASTSPAGAAVSAATGSMAGISEDTNRTSRMITAYLSEYMFKKGWIEEDKALKAKRNGEVL